VDPALAVSYTPIMAPDNRGIKAPRETTGTRGRMPAARQVLACSSLLEATKQKINQPSQYFSFYTLSVIGFNSTNMS